MSLSRAIRLATCAAAACAVWGAAFWRGVVRAPDPAAPAPSRMLPPGQHPALDLADPFAYHRLLSTRAAEEHAAGLAWDASFQRPRLTGPVADPLERARRLALEREYFQRRLATEKKNDTHSPQRR